MSKNLDGDQGLTGSNRGFFVTPKKIKLRMKIQTALRLGVGNVFVVVLYRLILKSGLYETILKKGVGYTESLFASPDPHSPCLVLDSKGLLDLADGLLAGRLPYFSHNTHDAGTPPDWFRSPINNRGLSDGELHWSRLNEFGSDVGDIKQIWEPSRFDWALVLARAFRVSNETKYFEALNDWAGDWTSKNPFNTGLNWKCGQEVGLRMLNVLLAAYLLQQLKTPSAGLVRFVTEHCSRIEPTLRYALAQDNNHGTSEAAALFIGGSWLQQLSTDRAVTRRAERWAEKGRFWLENRVNKLVAEDGSFSQNSLNYHRVLVDTLNFVEFCRRELKLEPFSADFNRRSRAAVEWLYQMIDGTSGDGPNLGANDGARLFVLSTTPYRDYRPSVQLGSVLFLGGKAYAEGPWDEVLAWLGLASEALPQAGIAKSSREFPNGGYCVVCPTPPAEGLAWGMLRLPQYRFRPSHCDGLHFDLWYKGKNILRDSGSYSYHSEEPWQSYFPSTSAHNTVEFDGRDQMPRLGRFLLGAWLTVDQHQPLVVKYGAQQCGASYRDYRDCLHKRTLFQEESHWRIVDEIQGRASKVALRWRLLPGVWQFEQGKLVGDLAKISVSCNQPIQQCTLVEGWESRHYLEKTKIPVFEIWIDRLPAIITTEIWLR